MVGGLYRCVILTTSLMVVLTIYILVYFPLDPWIFGIYNFFASLLDSWRFFAFGVVINEFPLHAMTGMYLTLLSSLFNLGYQRSLHT